MKSDSTAGLKSKQNSRTNRPLHVRATLTVHLALSVFMNITLTTHVINKRYLIDNLHLAVEIQESAMVLQLTGYTARKLKSANSFARMNRFKANQSLVNGNGNLPTRDGIRGFQFAPKMLTANKKKARLRSASRFILQ